LGVALSCFGIIYLAAVVNSLAGFLALLTLLTYLLVYTPLKRKTPFCVLVGALPGAMPPLIGWAAAAGRLSLEAWLLYAILFLWQFPHFMAIAWIYREDYSRANYLVLPRGEIRGRVMAIQSGLPCLLLVPASLAPLLLSHSHFAYVIVSIFVSMIFLSYALRLSFERSNAVARRLLFASLMYLPAIFFVMLLSKTT
jgi:protoheme IX farnesyltransferase